MDTGLYIGIMSGTSMDGIDAVLVDFDLKGHTLVSTINHPWPQKLQDELKAIALPGDNEINRLGALDRKVADHFAQAAKRLLEKASVSADQVIAIGSHGQTIRHSPYTDTPFTLQIGDPNRLAEETGITTVADFRRRDMAAGGQGAPLVCAFHQEIFGTSRENRAVLNIGGIANLTLLPSDHKEPTLGFDCGPGNTLMDAWTRRHLDKAYDKDGSWGATGNTDNTLLEAMLQCDYLKLAPPKSTGPELFNLNWLDSILEQLPELKPENVQATLSSFSAKTIANSLSEHAPDCERVIACGGGIHNKDLMLRLGQELKIPLEISSDHGLDPDNVEATAFAWLARQTMCGLPGNLPAVTGASGPRILGGIFPGKS